MQRKSRVPRGCKTAAFALGNPVVGGGRSFAREFDASVNGRRCDLPPYRRKAPMPGNRASTISRASPARPRLDSALACTLLTIPPSAGAPRPTSMRVHETAIYALSGETHCWFGERLANHCIARGRDVLTFPPASRTRQSQRQAGDCDHRPAPIRTSRRAWVLLPDLEKFVDPRSRRGSSGLARRPAGSHLGGLRRLHRRRLS
jgi:hypothetical protein